MIYDKDIQGTTPEDRLEKIVRAELTDTWRLGVNNICACKITSQKQIPKGMFLLNLKGHKRDLVPRSA